MRFIRWSSLLALLLAGCQASMGASTPGLGLPAVDPSVAMGHLGSEVVAAYKKQALHPPPMSFAPSDGGELALVSLAAEVTIEGPLAHTELHLAFHNPDARVREGRFAIALPPNAAVARFAMKNGEEWRESRVVSRAKGRQVYEQFLRHGIDPALVEQDAGNQFSARVFPIPASADKELILAYDDRVSASEPYTLSLRGLPAVHTLSVAITQDGARRSYAKSGEQPDDVVVAISPAADAVSNGSAFVARVDPVPGELAPAPLDRVLLLVDTSASRAPIMGEQAELVRRLAAAMPDNTLLSVAVFDQGVTEVFRGEARDAAPAADAILAHGALGASDLGAALAYAESSGMRRLVLVGDGLPTLGESDPAMLAALVKSSRIGRVDAVRVGQTVDRDVLGPIVAAGRAPGAILDGNNVARVLRQLTSALPTERPIHVAGASETWPATTRGIAAGDPVWVFGHRAANAAVDASLAISIGDRMQQVTPHVADATRTSRAVVRAEILALGDQMATAPPAERTATRALIEQLALAHHLVSSETSLIVLETDAQESRLLGPAAVDEDTQAAELEAVAAARENRDPVTKGEAAGASSSSEGEVIQIHGHSPTIDATATTQGITIDRDYIRNVPVGRTFESALGGAAGSQSDSQVDNLMTAGADPSMIVQQMARDGARRDQGSTRTPAPPEDADTNHYAKPYTGMFDDVMTALARKDKPQALELATRWHVEHPGDPAALIALGEALEARGSYALAARAYGSLIDLYPGRPEMDRAAGERFDRMPGARDLAIDAYRRALREGPDQGSTYHLLAFDLMREQRIEALDVIAKASEHVTRPSVKKMLEEDGGIIGAYLMAHVPTERAAILARWHGAFPTQPSLRVVLSWETDANDVDLHIRDRNDAHAFFASPTLPSGGALREDIRDGFGPELFAIDAPKAFPYRIGAHYYNRGPMGIGFGSMQIIHCDSADHVTIEDRPFVIQNENSMAELGTIERAPVR